jgi:hypothetical protein
MTPTFERHADEHEHQEHEEEGETTPAKRPYCQET